MTSAEPDLAVYRIVAIPGDGVGPEVVEAARRVMYATGLRFGFAVEWTEVLAGGIAIDTHGVAIRPEDVATCGAADAILLGAVGGPKWSDPAAPVRPEQALFALRGGLGLYANLRPVTVHPDLAASSPVRADLLAGVDMLIVRELTGGVYFGAREEAASAAEPAERRALDTMPYSESEIRRIVELAFELARTRRGHVTSVDKANVLATSRLWRTVADEVGSANPDVTLAHQLVDSCAMLLVRRPADFDVIVTENLFGDILSDEIAGLVGGLGMAPGANIGVNTAIFEAVHGSAPDIAGKGIANPTALLLAACMMLDHVERRETAARIRAAIDLTLRVDQVRTGDLGGKATTAAYAAAVARNLAA